VENPTRESNNIESVEKSGNTATNTFRDGASCAVFSSSLTTLDDDDRSKTFLFDPSLKLAKFRVQPVHFCLVLPKFQLPVVVFIFCH
jgi:hypothetical protein